MTAHGSCLALGAALLLAQPAPQQEPPQTFRSSADAVSVEASVRREKRPVTGLKLSDFELLDNGIPQEISDLSYERLPRCDPRNRGRANIGVRPALSHSPLDERCQRATSDRAGRARGFLRALWS